MSTPNDPFNQTLVGWQGSAIAWKIALTDPIDLTTLAAWDPAGVYTGIAPASLVLFQNVAWQAVAPVIAEAPGTVAGHWILVTAIPTDVSGWWRMFTVKSSYSDPDQSSVYVEDVQMPAGSIDGVLSGELPDNYTQKIRGGSSLPFDVRVITLTSSTPQMMYAGQIYVGRSVGTRILPNVAPNIIWTPPA